MAKSFFDVADTDFFRQQALSAADPYAPWREAMAANAAALPPEPEPSEFEKGLSLGWKGFEAGTMGAGANLAAIVGAKDRERELAAEQQRLREEMAGMPQPRVSRVGQVKSVGDALDYGAQGLGQLTTSALTMLGAGKAGKLLLGGLGGLATRSAAGLRAGAQAGEFLGAYASSAAPQLGDLYEENPQSPQLNLAASALQGGLDVYPYMRAMKLLGRLPTAVVENKIKPFGTELIKQMGIEGGTETLQQVIHQAVSVYNDPAKSMWSDEAKEDYLDNFVLGALGGGVIGGGIDVAGRALSKVLPASPSRPTLRSAEQPPPPVGSAGAAGEADTAIPEWRQNEYFGPWPEKPPVQTEFQRAEVLEPPVIPEPPGFPSRPKVPQRPSLMQQLQSEARGQTGYSEQKVTALEEEAQHFEQLSNRRMSAAEGAKESGGPMAASLAPLYVQRAQDAMQRADTLYAQAEAMRKRGEAVGSPLARMMQQSTRRDDDGTVTEANQGFDVRRVGYGAEYDFPTQYVQSVDNAGKVAMVTTTAELNRLYQAKMEAQQRRDLVTDRRTKAYRQAKRDLESIDAQMKLLHEERGFPIPYFSKEKAQERVASLAEKSPNDTVETVPYWDYLQGLFEKEGRSKPEQEQYLQEIAKRLDRYSAAPKREDGETTQQYLSRLWVNRTTPSDLMGRLPEASLSLKQLREDANARGETVLTTKGRNLNAIAALKRGVRFKNKEGKIEGVDFPRLIELQRKRWAGRLPDMPESERTAFYLLEGLSSAVDSGEIANLAEVLDKLPPDTVVSPKSKEGENPDIMWGEIKAGPGVLARARGRVEALNAKLERIGEKQVTALERRDQVLEQYGSVSGVLQAASDAVARFEEAYELWNQARKELENAKLNLERADNAGRPTESLTALVESKSRVKSARAKVLAQRRATLQNIRRDLLTVVVGNRQQGENAAIERVVRKLERALDERTMAQEAEEVEAKARRDSGAEVFDDDVRPTISINKETGAKVVEHNERRGTPGLPEQADEGKEITKQDTATLPPGFVPRAKNLLTQLLVQKNNAGVMRALLDIGFPRRFLEKPFGKTSGKERWVLAEPFTAKDGTEGMFVTRAHAVAFLDALLKGNVALPVDVMESLEKANPQDVAPPVPEPRTQERTPTPETTPEQQARRAEAERQKAIAEAQQRYERLKVSIAALLQRNANMPESVASLALMRRQLAATEQELARLRAEAPVAPATDQTTIVQGTYTGGTPTIHSGGATGADTVFSQEAHKLGFGVQTHSFEEHDAYVGPKDTLLRHTPAELAQANELLRTVNRQWLKRAFPSTNETVNNLLRRNYFQVKDADAVVAIGHIKNGVVDGGTAWAVYMGVELGKPVYVFDMQTNEWAQLAPQGVLRNREPPLFQSFAGIGSRRKNLTLKGAQAARDYMARYSSTARLSDEGAGQNKELSDFAPRKFYFEGRPYLSVEQAYQSLKSGTFEPRVYNAFVTTKGVGKPASGSSTKTEGGWNLQLMKRLMKASFDQNPQAAKRLLNTGDEQITNNSYTEFPHILMEVRNELRTQEADSASPKLTGANEADAASPDNAPEFRAAAQPSLGAKVEQWNKKTKSGENKALRVLADKLSQLFGLGKIVLMSPKDVVDHYAKMAENNIGKPAELLDQLFRERSIRYGRFFGISPDGTIRIWVDPARTKTQRVVTLIHEVGHGVFRSFFDGMPQATRDAMRAEWDQHVQQLRADPTKGNWARMQTPPNFDTLTDAITQEQLPEEFMPYATDFEEWVVNRIVQWVGKNAAPRSLVDEVFKGIADFLTKLYKFAKDGNYQVSRTVEQFIEDVIARHGDATLLRQQTVNNTPPTFTGVLARQAAFIERALTKLAGLRMQAGQGGGRDGARVLRAMDDFSEPEFTGRSAEAIIDALKTLLKPAEWALLGRAARTPGVLNQIRHAFEGHDQVLERLDFIQRRPDKRVDYDPVDYAVAYMFMLRAAGIIEVGPETLRTFKAFHGRVQALWKRMSGMRSSAEQLQSLLEGFTNQGILVRAQGSTWELPQHLRQKVLHRAMQRVYRIAKSFRDNVYGKAMRTAQERLMATNNPYLQYIAQMFHATSYGAAQAGSYFERLGTKFGEIDRKLQDALGKYLEDDEFLADLSAALRNPDVRALATPEVQRVAKALTDTVFTPLYHYMKSVGIEVEYRKDYYPWFIDMLEVGKVGETAMLQFFAQRHFLPHWDEVAKRYNERLPQTLKHQWTREGKDKGMFVVDGHLRVDAWQRHLSDLAKNEAARNPLTVSDAMKRVYEQWTQQTNIEIITDERELLHNPKMGFINARELNFLQSAGTAADREFLANLFQKDMRVTLAQYIMNAVKRSEFARIAGPNGEWMYDQYKDAQSNNPLKDSALRDGGEERVVRGLLDEARRAGASERDVTLAKAYINAMAGMGGIDTKKQLDALIEWSPLPRRWKKSMMEGVIINPRLQRAFGWITVYQNYRLLGLSPLSSLIDPLGIAVRGNDMVLTIRGMKEAMTAMSDKAAGEPNHLMWMAELIGVLDRHLLSDAVMQQYMGPSQYQTPLQAKMNEALFRGNMMIALTRFSRLAALAAGKSFLKRHTLDPVQHSIRYMDELGLRRGDVKIDDSGELELLSDEQRNRATPEEYARDERVRLALYRFVEQSIIRPDPAQRTLWMSDPHLQLVGYLRSFMFSFYERVLKRVTTEAIDYGNVGPLLIMMLSYLPVMIMADLLRDLIQNGGEAPWKKAWGVSDYVAYGAKRAGFMGKYEGIAHDWEAQAGPTLEQLYDLFASRPSLEQDVVRALPLNNIYRNWFKQPKAPKETHYGQELDQGSDQKAWSAT